MQKINLNHEGGYTLIETMIAISLFLVVVVTGMGTLLNANLLQQKSQDVRSIIDNLNFVMEDMSRNLRTGYMYKCYRRGVDLTLTLADISASPTTRSCSDGWAIAFESNEPSIGNPAVFTDQWVYYIDNTGKIFKSTNGLQTAAVQMTPDEVVVNSISGFSVLGAEPPSLGDAQQPVVIIKLVGTITSKSVATPFSVQTAISQRLIDV